MSSKKKWMQEAVNPKEKGELHKKLKVPADKKIPTALLKKKKKELQERAKGDKKLTKAERELLGQVIFALNARKAALLDQLVKVAGALDEHGLVEEANSVDVILDTVVFEKNAATLPVIRLSPQYQKVEIAIKALGEALSLPGSPNNKPVIDNCIALLKSPDKTVKQ